MNSYNPDIEQVIDGVLEADGVIRCHEVNFSAQEGPIASRGGGVSHSGCLDPTVLQALSDQSILSLQISSESSRGGTDGGFALKVERFVPRRRASRSPAWWEAAGAVSEETCIQFATHRVM
jgi:hypothetical protein